MTWEIVKTEKQRADGGQSGIPFLFGMYGRRRPLLAARAKPFGRDAWRLERILDRAGRTDKRSEEHADEAVRESTEVEVDHRAGPRAARVRLGRLGAYAHSPARIGAPRLNAAAAAAAAAAAVSARIAADPRCRMADEADGRGVHHAAAQQR
eukprot:6031232-Pleurochrysis_carterae.AAC.1